MPITRLDITDFRNLCAVKLEPLPAGFNLLYGLNGSGKTSLLEAIYYLSLGRSFRSALAKRVIRRDAEKFVIFSQVSGSGAQVFSVGIERHLQGELKIRIANRDVPSAAELAELAPVQLINSNCYSLLDGGPVFRRKYLDWGCFYFNTEFLRVWRDYGQVLKQRNAVLRQQGSRREIEVWTQGLVKAALQFDRFRREYVQQLLPVLEQTIGELLIVPGLKIGYQPGWDEEQEYADVLASSYLKDSQFGYTQNGPHRADLRITINKIAAKDILSRGQQKLFVCAMILAQSGLLKSSVNKGSIYLIDDLPAELDMVSRSKLIALLSKQETQVFVTAVEREALGDALTLLPVKMFHVEHGSIMEEGILSGVIKCDYSC